uniref:Uncharacterized protein n=1 Tax=Erpetoichthys calabaricus TaxID=27687 RepID=A0A8C4TIT3_ERPCA
KRTSPGRLFVSQDEFICLVCRDTLNDPVSILCGHSFCMKCLTKYWDQSQVCSCPHCRRTFTPRPELSRNTALNEVIRKLKKTGLSPHPQSQNYAGPGDVKCDFCTKKKSRAVKSCLTCLASFCQSHLQPHFEGDALKHHKLVDPDGNLKEKLCSMGSSKQLSKDLKTKIVESPGLGKGYKKPSQRFKLSVSVTVRNGIRKWKATGTVAVKPSRSGRPRKIQERHMSRIVRMVTDNPQISSKDLQEHLAADGVSVHRYTIQSNLHKEHLYGRVMRKKPFLHSHFCPLTLDINTAHRELRLSEGDKKVTCEGTKTEYPDHPDRFDHCPQVLCREGLTGTRCYWEVECNGDYVSAGVSYKGLSRKGWGEESGLGFNSKSWSLLCFNSQYFVYHNNEESVISAPYSPRIGVYLDRPAGSLSFYSVSHTMTLLHRFNTSFTEPLYPGFYLDDNCSSVVLSLDMLCPSIGHSSGPSSE